ncbi:MAG: hypothetical protein J7K40_08005 [candidate division Zixibacteria bacterium]|nr:hypothetical protein [candidate division Zixibacteria bacterium]
MAKKNEINPEELRYNYLGFEVVPGKLKEFWDSDEEKKSYIDKIREKLKTTQVIERDFSVVNSSQMNKADRIIISVASVFLILSLLVPYYNFEAFGGKVSGSAISYLANLGYISNFLAWGSLTMKLTLVFSVFMIFFSPVIGILNLIALNSGRNKANYFSRLKSISRLNILAILLYIALFALVASGQLNPFGSLGIEALGENFTLLSVINMASVSIWLNIAAHLLGLLPALEL